jgi:uncharacterized membrane protein HdeD (DUF308 family)
MDDLLRDHLDHRRCLALFSPLWGAVVLWWLIGISAVVMGIIQIGRAFSFGK